MTEREKDELHLLMMTLHHDEKWSYLEIAIFLCENGYPGMTRAMVSGVISRINLTMDGKVAA